jgi:acetylornithine deacetylase/succinyl-diaminopimelate desuccinylase-like protein
MRTTIALIAVVLLGCGGAPRPQAGRTDLDREGQEAVDLLQAMLRFDTINPPQPGSSQPNANETALLRHVKGILAADGIESEIHESAPGRGNLVARIRGSGEKKPVLLMAHVDVVNVDRAKWDVDPLSGLLKDGFLWGRGALDDKDDAAVFAQVMRILARTKPALKRDVILMLNADEESSARFGAEWMVRQHWDKVACEFVLNEGGSAALRGGKPAQFGFQTAEKIYNDFRIWVRGEAGHSSTPLPRNAIYEAGKLLEKLERFRTPLRLTETVKASLAALAGSPAYARWSEPMKKAGSGDLTAAEELCQDPRFNAQLRSTFVPTIVQGGIRENVLPSDVEINFNARLLPGDRIDDLIKAIMEFLEIRKFEVVEGEEAIARFRKGKAGADVAVFLMDRGVDAPASSLHTEMFRALEAAAKKHAPDAVAAPLLGRGATDSRFFRLKGVDCYGIAPCPVGEEEEPSVHGHNERVRVDSVKFGVKFVLDALLEVCR